MTDYSAFSLEELVQIRAKMAQRVNRQLRQLAKKGYTRQGEALNRKAQTYLDRQGRSRFSERKTPFDVTNPYKETKAGTRLKTPGEMRAEQKRKELAEIAQMERFQESKSYKISDIKESREKMRKTMKEEYGVDLSEEDLTMIFEVDAWQWVRQTYGSQTVNELAKAVNEGQATVQEVTERINAMRARYEETKLKDMSVEDLFDELGLKYKPEYRQQKSDRKAATDV